MKLKLIQNSVGKFNLFSSEKSLSFSLGLVGDDGQIIEEDGIKAILYYSGDPEDKYIFNDWKNELEEIFELCYTYSKRIISTISYGKQCELFAKLYKNNYEQINETMTELKREEILKKIDSLKEQLKNNKN